MIETEDFMETVPSRFIDEPIEAIFLEAQTYEKRPECPQGFIWREETYEIVEVLSERQDFTRRGRFANNMSTGHLRSAMRLGSWGVGRYEFCVRVKNDRIFDIYFDRAPQGAGDRKGHWFLKGERIAKTRLDQ